MATNLDLTGFSGDEIIYVGDRRIRAHLRDRIDFNSIRDPHEHHEPRMWGVHALPYNWWMWPGEWAEVDVPDEAVLLGVVLELATHHPRARLYLNGENVLPDQLDGFCMGKWDGIGCVKWFMVPRGPKTVRLLVMDDYNPIMREDERTKGSGFCLGGFIFRDSFDYPPPIYASTTWTEERLNDTGIPASPDGGQTPGLRVPLDATGPNGNVPLRLVPV